MLASHYGGKELNSPNDVVGGKQRRDLLHRPGLWAAEYYGVPRPPQLAFRGVYRIAPDGSRPALLANDFAQPNGLCLSPTKAGCSSTTPSADISARSTSAPTAPSRRQGMGEPRQRPGAADGMKIDSQGRLYCTGPGGIHVFDRRRVCWA